MPSISLMLSALLALSSIQNELKTNEKLDLNEAHWVSFKRDFNKTYSDSQEETWRRAIFFANKIKVDKLNVEDKFAHSEVNRFSDLSDQEKRTRFGLKIDQGNAANSVNTPEAEAFLQSILNDPTPIPDQIDWSFDNRRVNESPRDQFDCAISWAFSVAGTLEGQEIPLKISKRLIKLSTEQFVGCDRKNHGCEGGDTRKAFEYVHTQGGLMSASSYPAYSGPGCNFDEGLVIMSNKGWAGLPVGDEEALKKVVAKFGPVSVGIDASNLAWNQVKVFSGPCDNKLESINQAFLLVGYGRDEGKDFWKIKSSWGIWGDKGYYKIERNKGNLCGIATYATIPTF